MATITITYNKPINATQIPVAQICAVFVPTNAAADSNASSIKGSYYDTNVEGYGAGMTPEEFFNSQVAHPGLIAALRAAMRAYVPAEGDTPATPGVYVWETTDEEVQYAGELENALKDQGFDIKAGSASSGT